MSVVGEAVVGWVQAVMLITLVCVPVASVVPVISTRMRMRASVVFMVNVVAVWVQRGCRFVVTIAV